MKQELCTAIAETGLAPRHQRALREVLGHVTHPVFLGYIVYAVGLAVLVSFLYMMRVVLTAHTLEVDAEGSSNQEWIVP